MSADGKRLSITVEVRDTKGILPDGADPLTKLLAAWLKEKAPDGTSVTVTGSATLPPAPKRASQSGR